MNAPLLSVRDLKVTLNRGRRALVAVDGISFDVKSGEILALVGESGCGKSKTAEALLGLVPASVGTVTASSIDFLGRDLRRLSDRAWRKLRGREISMVFQEPLTALDPVFTIGGQLAAVLRRHRALGRAAARETAAEMLRDVGIADATAVLDRYPHQLSGGMRQRVIVAMAMACHPQLLIADEPTTALDVTTQAQVLSRMTDLAREAGTAILLITHDLGIVAHYADRALVMRRGRILEENLAADLFRKPGHPYTAELLSAARGASV
jgi:ABC-type dipeptide/oligopeptide/nickel transport system ATPase component